MTHLCVSCTWRRLSLLLGFRQTIFWVISTQGYRVGVALSTGTIFDILTLCDIFESQTFLRGNTASGYTEINFCAIGFTQLCVIVSLWILGLQLWHLQTIINVIYNMTDLIVSCWRRPLIVVLRFLRQPYIILEVVRNVELLLTCPWVLKLTATLVSQYRLLASHHFG